MRILQMGFDIGKDKGTELIFRIHEMNIKLNLNSKQMDSLFLFGTCLNPLG